MPRSQLTLDAHRAQAFAAALRTQRSAAGLTQEELAENAGLSVVHVQRLEGGQGNPTLSTLYALSAALRVGVHALIPT